MKSFWRGIAIFILGGVLGTGFGVALGFFIFPYVFPPPAAAEQLADAERSIATAFKQRLIYCNGQWYYKAVQVLEPVNAEFVQGVAKQFFQEQVGKVATSGPFGLPAVKSSLLPQKSLGYRSAAHGRASGFLVLRHGQSPPSSLRFAI
jgi:hypothetical protein